MEKNNRVKSFSDIKYFIIQEIINELLSYYIFRLTLNLTYNKQDYYYYYYFPSFWRRFVYYKSAVNSRDDSFYIIVEERLRNPRTVAHGPSLLHRGDNAPPRNAQYYYPCGYTYPALVLVNFYLPFLFFSKS